jgi:phospholipid/cholesterol/gamma-HCH transport system substrate-binding protein
MDRSTIDLWVGVLVALGVAAFFGLAMKVGNLTSSNLGETYTVSASFENIGGLKPHAPIKSAGVVIGRVDGITFNTKNYAAEVTLKIDKRYPFATDTFANIYTAGLLGEQYVGLEQGGEETVLKNGDKILKTQSAIVLEQMISKFLFSKASEETPAKTADAEAKNTGKAKSTELGDAPF